MSRATQQWGALLAGPVIWFASLLANFAIASQVCGQGGRGVLLAVVAIALVVTASAGLFARKLWLEAGAGLSGESGGAVAGRRTLGLAGVLLNAMFLIVIVAQCVPNLVFRGCG